MGRAGPPRKQKKDRKTKKDRKQKKDRTQNKQNKDGNDKKDKVRKQRKQRNDKPVAPEIGFLRRMAPQPMYVHDHAAGLSQCTWNSREMTKDCTGKDFFV